eukprot:SAG31_NODE_1838_length_7128_cov_4.274125_1_plen_195_part_00
MARRPPMRTGPDCNAGVVRQVEMLMQKRKNPTTPWWKRCGCSALLLAPRGLRAEILTQRSLMLLSLSRVPLDISMFISQYDVRYTPSFALRRQGTDAKDTAAKFGLVQRLEENLFNLKATPRMRSDDKNLKDPAWLCSLFDAGSSHVRPMFVPCSEGHSRPGFARCSMQMDGSEAHLRWRRRARGYFPRFYLIF